MFRQAIHTTETRYLSQDRRLESELRETTSPVRDSIPMDVDPESGSNTVGQGANLSGPTFADVVAGRNTSVFRPTPAEASASTIHTRLPKVSWRQQRSLQQFQGSLGLFAWLEVVV